MGLELYQVAIGITFNNFFHFAIGSIYFPEGANQKSPLVFFKAC